MRWAELLQNLVVEDVKFVEVVGVSCVWVCVIYREILQEESHLEQMSGRRYNSELKSSSPIMKDPDAPSKPLRQPYAGGALEPGYSLGRVSSDSNGSRLSHSNDLQVNVS